MRSPTDRRPALRSDERREAILDALDGWLQESSLDAVNVAEITAQAGVTRSAFYFYFENKAAAVAALIERLVAEVFVVSDEFTTGSGDPRERVYAMLEGLFDSADRYRHVFSAMLEARGSSAAVRQIWDDGRDAFTPSVTELIRAERSADSPDPEVLAAVLLEFNDRMVERFLFGGALTRDQLIDGAAAIWLSTIYGENR
ncbi:TetR family transcriptional regulator [Mycobacterium adipatum]|jgi:AcrR family transcriptional regulator|uniref:TetR family transcriptional regulator n=1 Tax=Mycobacterium adipatum TaxID=1682113 RepID=A0A172URA5_9MYCO|nr:TetR/AcrR family transcriptional regulator [Mycobacterium adipatum]ANE81488.1 TetR family transcriptional regulator [Mycobacterium adipatum]MBI5737637.1 TetR/AcrR family transcriptional regulator [Mycolicibacterium neoaurum]